MSFDNDLLLYWFHLMTDDSLARRIGALFDHVLVDEYQDTDTLQAEILRRVKPDGRGVTVVGDDAQSIYSFRAASVGNPRTRATRWPPSASRSCCRAWDRASPTDSCATSRARGSRSPPRSRPRSAVGGARGLACVRRVVRRALRRGGALGRSDGARPPRGHAFQAASLAASLAEIGAFRKPRPPSQTAPKPRFPRRHFVSRGLPTSRVAKRQRAARYAANCRS